MKLGILGGYDLEKDYPFAKNQMLVCVTEMNTRKQIDALVAALRVPRSMTMLLTPEPLSMIYPPADARPIPCPSWTCPLPTCPRITCGRI